MRSTALDGHHGLVMCRSHCDSQATCHTGCGGIHIPVSNVKQTNQRTIRSNGSERIMTVLGAVVFGGLLALGVLWLLVTAPANEAQEAWDDSQRQVRSNSASTSANAVGSSSWLLTHSSQK